MAEKDYEKVCGLSPEFKEYNFREVCEANLLMNSRSFGITVDKDEIAAMVPFADMVNHRHT